MFREKAVDETRFQRPKAIDRRLHTRQQRGDIRAGGPAVPESFERRLNIADSRPFEKCTRAMFHPRQRLIGAGHDLSDSTVRQERSQ